MKKAVFILMALLMVVGLVALVLPTETQATTDNGIYIESVNPNAPPPGYLTVLYYLVGGDITIRLSVNNSSVQTETKLLPTASMAIYVNDNITITDCDYRDIIIDHDTFLSVGPVHFGNFSGLLPGTMDLTLRLAADASGKLYVENICYDVDVSSTTTKGNAPETSYVIGDGGNDSAGSAMLGTAPFEGKISIGGSDAGILPLYSEMTTEHSSNLVISLGNNINNSTLEGDGVPFPQFGGVAHYVGTQGTLVVTGAVLNQQVMLTTLTPIEYQFKIRMQIGPPPQVTPSPSPSPSASPTPSPTPTYPLTVNQTSSCCNVNVSGYGIVNAGSSNTWNISNGSVINVNASYNGSCNTWVNWVGGVATASAMNTTITMNTAKSITANCSNVAGVTPTATSTIIGPTPTPTLMISMNAPQKVNHSGNFTTRVDVANLNLTAGNYSASYIFNYDKNVIVATNVSAGLIGSSVIPVSNWSFVSEGVQGVISVVQNISTATALNGSGILANISFDVVGGYDNTSDIKFNVSNCSVCVLPDMTSCLPAGWLNDMVRVATPTVQNTYNLTVNQTSSCCNVSVAGYGNVTAGSSRTWSDISSGTVINVNASFNGSCNTWGNWIGSVSNISAMNTTITMSANRSITANCTYTSGPGPVGGSNTPSWLWPVVGVMLFLTLALFGYAANRAGWIGKPKGWFGGHMEDYTADGFGEEDVYDKLYGDTGGIEKGTGGGSDMGNDEL